MHGISPRRLLSLLALGLLAGCHHQPFLPSNFPSSRALFEASVAQLKAHHWDNAVSGFEQLTTSLPARDPLLPEAYYFLGQAHEGNDEYILAAQAYSRVPESFPEDTLAAPATFEAGMAYSHLWRKPSLDPDYGKTSITTLQSFLAAYPDSPLATKAQAEIDKLDEWLATKDYDTGMFYLRRKAYDPSIIYFKDVARLYPKTKHARLALMRLVQAYREIRYTDEAAETCDTLRTKYPRNADVRDECGAAPVAATPKPKP